MNINDKTLTQVLIDTPDDVSQAIVINYDTISQLQNLNAGVKVKVTLNSIFLTNM